MRLIHRGIGVAAFAAFLATGWYLRVQLPWLHSEPVLRMMFRASPGGAGVPSPLSPSFPGSR